MRGWRANTWATRKSRPASASLSRANGTYLRRLASACAPRAGPERGRPGHTPFGGHLADLQLQLQRRRRRRRRLHNGERRGQRRGSRTKEEKLNLPGRWVGQTPRGWPPCLAKTGAAAAAELIMAGSLRVREQESANCSPNRLAVGLICKRYHCTPLCLAPFESELPRCATQTHRHTHTHNVSPELNLPLN